ncbi:hypothetical protein BKA81DRAFT_50665 [Phyllosticta paracitricarpa]
MLWCQKYAVRSSLSRPSRHSREQEETGRNIRVLVEANNASWDSCPHVTHDAANQRPHAGAFCCVVSLHSDALLLPFSLLAMGVSGLLRCASTLAPPPSAVCHSSAPPRLARCSIPIARHGNLVGGWAAVSLSRGWWVLTLARRGRAFTSTHCTAATQRRNTMDTDTQDSRSGYCSTSTLSKSSFALLV